MQEFSIITRLEKNEYIKFMLIGLYKKPAFILSTLIGLFLATTVFIDYLKLINFYKNTPFFEIIMAIFLLLAPILIVIITLRQFLSNPSFQNEINYTFSENGITIKGLTFKSEFVWSHITKQKVIGKFLILYHSKKFGNYIDKSKLTETQLNFIKSKIEMK